MALNDIQDRLGLSGKSADLERRLDDAVAQSFPASDPVALSQPHSRHEMGMAGSISMTHVMLVGGGLLAILAIIALRR